MDQTAMFANGFLVGDAQVQTKYHFEEIEHAGAPAHPGRLPAAWRTDYQTSLQRNTQR